MGNFNFGDVGKLRSDPKKRSKPSRSPLAPFKGGITVRLKKLKVSLARSPRNGMNR